MLYRVWFIVLAINIWKTYLQFYFSSSFIGKDLYVQVQKVMSEEMPFFPFDSLFPGLIKYKRIISAICRYDHKGNILFFLTFISTASSWSFLLLPAMIWWMWVYLLTFSIITWWPDGVVQLWRKVQQWRPSLFKRRYINLKVEDTSNTWLSL